MALVAEEQCDGIATIIGEARYVIDTSGEAAELAVVVADDWQGLGLAQEMLRRLFGRAMAAGIARFTAETMASNHCILHLARKAGFSIYPVRDVAVLRLEREIDPTRAGV